MFTTLDISQIHISPDRQRKDLGDLSSLKDSMRVIGLINPLVVDDDYNLIAGERRYTAARELGWSHINVQRMGDLEPLAREQVELDENIKRKDLTWQEECEAILRYHELGAERHPEEKWSFEKTAEQLGMSKDFVYKKTMVAGEIRSGNETIATADKYSTARGLLERKIERAKSQEDEKLDGLLADRPTERQSEVLLSDSLPQSGKTVEAERRTSVSTDTSGWHPFENADFTQWCDSFSGEKFNFLHCDFPYGINAEKHDQGAKTFGEYEDSADTYFNLLECLADNMDKLILPSAHMMFWFSHNHYTPTKEALEAMGWKVNPTPLIWLKIDNSGIIPDPKRMPRQIYEAAFMCSRGDRFIVRAKSNAIGYPNQKTIHKSEKPRPMLGHFFQMFVDDSTKMLDPTAGSGNAVLECLAQGGSAWGLEINEEFYSAAVENFKKGKEDAND